MTSLQRRHRAQIGDDIGQIGSFQSGIGAVGHRLLEGASIARYALGNGADDFGIGPGAPIPAVGCEVMLAATLPGGRSGAPGKSCRRGRL
jgi:hypothetical protein